MAWEDELDPKIQARLKNVPPFDNDDPSVPPAQPPAPPQDPSTEPEVETPETPAPAPEAEKPPEVTTPPQLEDKDRTAKEFEKLKEHNASLKEQLEAEKAKNIPTKDALEALIPEPQYPQPPVYPQPLTTNVIPTPQQYPNLSQKEIKDTFNSLVDSQGYVDTGLLIETLKTTDERAKAAEQRAKEAEERNKRNERRMDDFERKELMKQVHDLYPKLNPENANSDDPDRRFDDNFYEAFQGEVMRQWSTVGKEDVWIAAKKWSGILYGNNPSMTKADKEKAEQAELAKRNINATNVQPTSQRESFSDQDELVKAVQLGKKGALAERLRRAGL